ncbi:NAD(P)/FAD-dependent oxidoreductase [Lactovum miscens]|uniref:NADH:ubiquinone reductase (non-electrogenic) n=1 Tax=Lactovum miscens TaxID=190387 RepID=A0A841C5E2_9LACT|nr:NAD(P)/FAD-dependent oxidoreductase [Lactovum miscens]MBB5887487.1 NADH dehydrogenase [Lactovum miscens]
MTNKIIVVGAGFAGFKAIKILSKTLKTEAEITLIDRHSYHTMMTQLHEVAAGRVPFTNAQYDLGRLIGKKKNVHIVTAEVTSVDKKAKIVKTSNGDFEYDYIIVAMGAEPADFGVPGVKEHSFTLWSIEDAMKIKRHLEEIVQRASTELDDEKRKAMLTFSVAGSGFTGIEMAGELIEWRDVTAKAWKIDPKEFTLNVIEMMPTIMNVLDRKQADKGKAYMEKHGVNFLLNHGITEVGPDFVRVNVGGRDDEKVSKIIPTYTLIWTTGVQGNTQASMFELKETQRGHRLQANEYMEAVGFEGQGIYVAGDVSGFIGADGRPQPQIVEGAEQTAATAAANVIAEIRGTEKKKFEFSMSGTMVSIGGRYGVAFLFGKVRLSGFFAMFMKNFIYILYALQAGSLWYFFTYLKNEFFHTPDGRNLGRGHFSRLGNVLWSFPLRLFYGLLWLLDAFPKLFGNADQSWMGDTVKISTFVKGQSATGWLVKPVAKVAKVASDAAAGASTTASSAAYSSSSAADAAAGASTTTSSSTAEAVVHHTNALVSWWNSIFSTNIDASGVKHVWSLNYEYGTIPKPTTSGVPSWMVPIMKLFVPNYETALLLQKVMSIVELILALGIIFGAFTWIASAATAVLTLMFATTGMLTWVSIWYVFVALALMNGSGRALGLDKWIQPWFQKHFFHWWYRKPQSMYK